MLSFTNNSGPLFIIGTVGISMFRNSSIGFLLLFTHILASISVGIIIGFISRIPSFNKVTSSISEANHAKNISLGKKQPEFADLGEILSSSIFSAIKTTLLIGGFVVLFSVVISILNNSNAFNALELVFAPLLKFFGINFQIFKGLLSGLVELTNGLAIISSIPIKSLTLTLTCCAFLLGFGGLSVLLQVLSIISKSGLSIKTYFLAKILQGIIAGFYTYILISNFSFFNFNL